jgi:hypothetical protein
MNKLGDDMIDSTKAQIHLARRYDFVTDARLPAAGRDRQTDAGGFIQMGTEIFRLNPPKSV